MAADDYTGALL